MRMDAYYYGFKETSVEEIDMILSAVACGGKAYHCTENWQDDSDGEGWGHIGDTVEEWIQNAANKAAKQLTK